MQSPRKTFTNQNRTVQTGKDIGSDGGENALACNCCCFTILWVGEPLEVLRVVGDDSCCAPQRQQPRQFQVEESPGGRGTCRLANRNVL